MSGLRRVPTGIKGLDEMLEGGLPEGRVILVCGGPGAGKTIFALQYLLANASRGEAGVYVTLEEPLSFIRQNVALFGWDLKKYERRGLLRMLDLCLMPYGEKLIMLEERSPAGDGASSLIREIRKAAENVGARHIAIDPITSITIHQPRAGKKRFMVGQIFQGLREIGCTSIITMEVSSLSDDFYMEKFLADGVILLESHLDEQFRLVQTLRIEKMRGTKHDRQPRRYVISNEGLMVYHTEPVRE